MSGTGLNNSGAACRVSSKELRSHYQCLEHLNLSLDLGVPNEIAMFHVMLRDRRAHSTLHMRGYRETDAGQKGEEKRREP